MAVQGYDFGHRTEWVYSDTKEPVGSHERKCPKCNQYRNADNTDPCWGKLSGVQSACCGHGNERPFIMLDNGKCLYGPDAEQYVNKLRNEL